MAELHDHLSSQQLLYATVWEDEALLTRALCISPDDDVLSICSAGCNVLALLAAGARSVTAVDLNPVQLALLDLKLSGIKRLSCAELAELVGESPSQRRLSLYEKVRPGLGGASRDLWDSRHELIARGIAQSGRLEQYFRVFAEQRLPQLWSAELAQAVVDEGDPGRRLALLRERGRLAELEQIVRSHFSAEAMARDGRSAAQLKHAQAPDVGAEMFRRFMAFVAERSWTHNHYLERLVRGHLRDPFRGPSYLQPAVFERLRARVDDVRLVRGDLAQVISDAPVGAFSKANLSDLFEYLGADEANLLFGTLEARLRAGGRMAYWNLLAPRVAPAQHGRLHTLERGPNPADRVFFYAAFVLQEIRD